MRSQPGTECRICLASVIRLDGPAPKGPENLAQGSGFTLGKAKYTFRPEGAGNANADAVRFEGSEPILAVPGGPYRANSGGWRFPRVNPGLCFLGHFGP